MEAQAAWREDGAMRNMNLSQVLLWWRAAPARRAPRPATPDWVNAGSEPNPEQLDDVLMGCGWFDSSHELNTGLQVTEHLTPERVVNEVPLGWWLDWQAHGPSEAGAQGRHSG
jgi:hypothetical protein